jgi:hypothetical protein
MVEARKEKKLVVLKKAQKTSSPAKMAVNASLESGGARLTKAVEDELLRQASDLARSLLDSAKKGNVSTTRLLLELSERQGKCGPEALRRTLRSMALELAAEPEWHSGAADSIEAVAEVQD